MTSNTALMVIDGEDVPAVGRDWFETRDPASGEVIARSEAALGVARHSTIRPFVRCGQRDGVVGQA
jgi:hypothetical protein